MERTPAEFMAARERLGMDRSDVARELGIDKRTVSLVWPDTDLIRSMRQKADERFQDRQQ